MCTRKWENGEVVVKTRRLPSRRCMAGYTLMAIIARNVIRVSSTLVVTLMT